ncbi:50S ribosomal protein L30 [Alistipes sp. OttesenSCG-928-B03]|nr:50S ribosomal protein L30 [Alistipes sp. OttesenSCG-928-B03]
MAKINITQVRSRIGSTKRQKDNLDALGLRKMGRTVQHEDSPMIMGMLEKVKHLVVVEMNAKPIEKRAETKAPKAVAPKAPKAEAKPAAEKKPVAKKTAEPKAEAAEE